MRILKRLSPVKTEQVSPFTREQLIPQEETLEVYKHKGQLFIGIPKENSYQEKRVCLNPDAVAALSAHGHRVIIESGAGDGAKFSDKDYSEAGAKITSDTKKVFSCPMILKVEPPTLEELEMMNPQTTIISALQLKTRKKAYHVRLSGVLARQGYGHLHWSTRATLLRNGSS